jgi:hypothetical protein
MVNGSVLIASTLRCFIVKGVGVNILIYLRPQYLKK